MEGDATKTTVSDITLSMGSVIGNIKETNETRNQPDAIPTSSSDTNIELTSEKSVEDSITSTSNVGDEVDFRSNAPEENVMDSTLRKPRTNKTDIENEADLFAAECNLSYDSTEKITENVEDIVTDLENLLEETSDDMHSLKNSIANKQTEEPKNILEEKIINNTVSKTDIFKIESVDTSDADKSAIEAEDENDDTNVETDLNPIIEESVKIESNQDLKKDENVDSTIPLDSEEPKQSLDVKSDESDNSNDNESNLKITDDLTASVPMEQEILSTPIRNTTIETIECENSESSNKEPESLIESEINAKDANLEDNLTSDNAESIIVSSSNETTTSNLTDIPNKSSCRSVDNKLEMNTQQSAESTEIKLTQYVDNKLEMNIIAERQQSAESTEINLTQNEPSSTLENDDCKMDVDDTEEKSVEMTEEKSVEMTEERPIDNSEATSSLETEKMDLDLTPIPETSELNQVTESVDDLNTNNANTENTENVESSKEASNPDKQEFISNEELKSNEVNDELMSNEVIEELKTNEVNEEIKPQAVDEELKPNENKEDLKSIEVREVLKPNGDNEEIKSIDVSEELKPQEVEEELKPNEDSQQSKPNEVKEELKPNEHKEELKSIEVSEELNPNVVNKELKSIDVSEELKPQEVNVELKAKEINEQLKPNEEDEELKPNEAKEELKSIEVSEELNPNEISEELKSIDVSEDLKPNEDDEKLKSNEVSEVLKPNEDNEEVKSNEDAEKLKPNEDNEEEKSNQVSEELKPNVDKEEFVSNEDKQEFATNEVEQQLISNKVVEEIDKEEETVSQLYDYSESTNDKLSDKVNEAYEILNANINEEESQLHTTNEEFKTFEEDELVKAAQEASFSSQEHEENFDNEASSNIEVNNPIINEDAALIQAAQESQNREIEQPIEPIKEISSMQFNQEEYHKPLNIFVDNIHPSQSVIKEAESTTNDENELTNKEVSSDDDKQAEYSSKMNQNEELKLTIRKNKAEESILKIYDPNDTTNMEISPSESETDPEETPIPKLIIKQSQCSPKLHSPLKITIKPVLKPEDHVQQKASPKITIKPIINPDEEIKVEERHHSPKITIKPIPKPIDEVERSHSPKVTIKPIIKPTEASMSPKIKIKPIIKPDEIKEEMEGDDSKERIVLKINIGQKEVTKKVEEIEKLPKMKLKFSKEGGHAHIVNEQQNELKRTHEDENDMNELSIKKIKLENVIDEEGTADPIRMEIKSEILPPQEEHSLMQISASLEPPLAMTPPTPRKRGRPRKVPLEVREEFKDPKEDEGISEENRESSSSRPKRSCRGPSVRTTLGIKPRKPRGAGRARGGRGRGRGGKVEKHLLKETISESKLKLIKEAALTAQINKSFATQDVLINHQAIVIEDSFDGNNREDLVVVKEEKQFDDNPCKTTDVVMYEEETRMSADINNSRAQTPAKQVFTQGGTDLVEESQSSVHSSATTESVKVRKGSRLEVFQEPEGSVISADQLAEYYWGGGGPFMLQEQVAQFLGIKSFKRKYPGIQRRAVDMQERDFIRESGLASEHMCDLGLTAVNSSDILDIMYSDFQNKYEEYCKHQRDRQTKDITNKQKALSLAASQEKNKLDIMQHAVESAAQWNSNFNKARREERRACMDLQTFTVNFPKGTMKQANKPKIGHYPIALVPGQYTDYYRTFTPTELNNLPLNTMLYHPIHVAHEEDSQSDGSVSETDSSSSGSDSSDSESSDDDCNMCVTPSSKRIAL